MWRAFVDELTPEGVHVIFTNDDSLDETTIRNEWTERKGLRRYGKVFPARTQAEIETFSSREIETLEAADIQVGGFVSPVVEVPVDPLVELKNNVGIALNAYESQARAVDLGLDKPDTLVALKQAYADAVAALEAAK